MFLHFKPYCYGWKIDSEEDEQSLLEAIEVTIMIAQRVGADRYHKMGINDVKQEDRIVPLFEIVNRELNRIGFVPLPEEKEPEYECVGATNQAIIETVNNLSMKGIWEALFMRLKVISGFS